MGRFDEHDKSDTHRFAMSQLQAQKQATVEAQLASHTAETQETNRRMLLKLMESIRYLLRQGLAFRGHDEEEGNILQLLTLRTIDVPELGKYLKNKTTYTSPLIQNEIMNLFGESLQRSIICEIKANGIYAIMVNGTQDYFFFLFYILFSFLSTKSSHNTCITKKQTNTLCINILIIHIHIYT